eukprot:15458820-Alexandrium_andersonii.AAC.1
MVVVVASIGIGIVAVAVAVALGTIAVVAVVVCCVVAVVFVSGKDRCRRCGGRFDLFGRSSSRAGCAARLLAADRQHDVSGTPIYQQ